jgi:hypothetical protein
MLQRVRYYIGLVTLLFPVQNGLLQFEKLVKVRQQTVQGTMYYFTIEAKDGEARKLYEAKVWEMLWENYKGLLEFKPAEMVPALKVDLFMSTWCQISSISFSKVSYLLLC